MQIHNLTNLTDFICKRFETDNKTMLSSKYDLSQQLSSQKTNKVQHIGAVVPVLFVYYQQCAFAKLYRYRNYPHRLKVRYSTIQH